MGDRDAKPNDVVNAENDAKYRREEIARMTRDTLLSVVASRPGKITAAMVGDIAGATHEACEAIHDACERFCLSPTEIEALELAESKALERAAKAQRKAAAKALEDAKDQDKKNADARAELASIEAERARRHNEGGAGQ